MITPTVKRSKQCNGNTILKFNLSSITPSISTNFNTNLASSNLWLTATNYLLDLQWTVYRYMLLLVSMMVRMLMWWWVMVGVRSRNAQLVFSERAVGPRHSTIDNRQTSIVDCRKSKIGDQSDCVLIVLAGFLFDNSTFDGSSTISWM